MSELIYKWLAGRESCHGGSGRWKLRQWREVGGVIRPCISGLHLCREGDLPHWISPDLYVAEYTGRAIANGQKVVVGRARIVEHLTGWNARTARHFAADCAERAIELNGNFTLALRSLIDDARQHADGVIDFDTLWHRALVSNLDKFFTYRSNWSARQAVYAAARGKSSAFAASSAASHTRAAASDTGTHLEEAAWQAKRILHYAHGGQP